MAHYQQVLHANDVKMNTKQFKTAKLSYEFAEEWSGRMGTLVEVHLIV